MLDDLVGKILFRVLSLNNSNPQRIDYNARIDYNDNATGLYTEIEAICWALKKIMVQRMDNYVIGTIPLWTLTIYFLRSNSSPFRENENNDKAAWTKRFAFSFVVGGP